jgi:hypothetical protein
MISIRPHTIYFPPISFDPNRHPLAGHSIISKMEKLNVFYIMNIFTFNKTLILKFKSEDFTIDIVSI